MKLLIANWKMNPRTEREAITLAKAEDAKGVVICPPFLFLEAVAKVLRHAELGSQDAFYQDAGAFTGEVSPKELKSLGVKYVIVGHSERRLSGETNEIIAKKVGAVMADGLTPILCVGESLEERQTGQTKEVLDKQLRSGLALVRQHRVKKPLLIAYEPVWSISTFKKGVGATPQDAAEMIEYIKSQTVDLARPPMILYGGSVDAADIAGFLRIKTVQGALVGGASLRATEFQKIIAIIKNKK